MSKPSKKQKVAEQVVYGVVWEVDVSIEDFGENTTVDCYGDEVEAAYEQARDEHEEKDKDHSPDVYASKASALEFAEKKFVELCGSHWHADEKEEEEEDEGKSPMDNPSLFKSGDGFSWNGQWVDQDDEHQMTGEISVRLKPMKLLA